MPVMRYLAVKALLKEQLDRQVPLPNTLEEWQDRQSAVVDLLADELAAWLRWKNPGVELPNDFVIEQAASFAAEILIPFTMASVKALQEPGAEERRH